MNQNPRRNVTVRKASLLFTATAVIGMGSLTVACSPRTEKPAETTAPSSTVSSTEKSVRTNVTRSPMVATPGGGGANPAVPCGFGPQGGGPCSNNNNN